MVEYYARWRGGYAPNKKTINAARKDAINYLRTHWDDRVSIMKETKDDIRSVGYVYAKDGGLRYYDKNKMTFYILHEWDGSIGSAIEKRPLRPSPFGL